MPWARRSERAKREAVDQVIHAFGIERFRRHQISELSTGTRRVVDLASIVLARPRLLLLDEPTAGIAQREAEAFVPLLRRLHQLADTTIVLVEHDVPLVFALCTKVVMMETGTVVSSGRPTRWGVTRGRWPPTWGPVRRPWPCPVRCRDRVPAPRGVPGHGARPGGAPGGPEDGLAGDLPSAPGHGGTVGDVAPQGHPVGDPDGVAVVVEGVVERGPVVPEGHRARAPPEPAGELGLLAVPVEHVEDRRRSRSWTGRGSDWVNWGLTNRPLRPFSGWVRTTGWRAGSSFS